MHSDTSNRVFRVSGVSCLEESWGQGLDGYTFEHNVILNIDKGFIDCTYQKFTEIGLLCSHCLRVLHTCCVQKVPDRYIMKRWSKGIKEIQSNELIVEGGMKDTAVCSSVWRMQMGRKMNALLTASQMNKEARLLCEEYFSKLQELIEVEVGSVYVEGDVQQDGSSSAKIVLNPPGSREKGQRNKRLKSTCEKKCNQAKARKKKKLSTHSIINEEVLPKVWQLL